MKVSARIAGRVTSISVRDSICAAHFLINGKQGTKVHDHVSDFIYSSLGVWNGDGGKGLSGFVQDRMIVDMLAEEDLEEFKNILREIKNG
jgi:nucleoid-associated protein YejK